MSSVTVGFETDGGDAVDGARTSPLVFVPESLLDVLGGVAVERGLSVGELWGSLCAFAAEGGGRRIRLLLLQADEDVEEHVFQVPDRHDWVSVVGRSGFIPLRRSEGKVSMVAPEPRVSLADAVSVLTGGYDGGDP